MQPCRRKQSDKIEVTNCWAIIALKPPPGRKSRLSAMLSASGRNALAEQMAKRVIRAAHLAQNITNVGVIGFIPEGAASGTLHIPDPGGGLNKAAQEALKTAYNGGAGRLIFLAADLPMVSSDEIDALAILPENQCAIAPDRAGSGTNALSIPLPHGANFQFFFGLASHAKHHDEALRLGLDPISPKSPGLAHDVDEPGDLAEPFMACQQL